ncbi:FT-interacting protein 3-like [Zingiber officinale]|uniref:C2 domain-containing protein n=1 Tax=Zingiber officinale TaxID=94328 RepID=A0A8J5I1T1_ZINOF|nr:FT-interacting protein 3-like [Zingiber officinale]KAG6533615.1 hypothetical protein ZIOFF_007490 [Zingiber officinale]
MGKEKLVVEVLAAHNLMPKDGQGSSSPYVEVEFEYQRQRTQPKHKDLNPAWNEQLLFDVSDPDDLPYRSIDVGVYNERGAEGNGAGGRNFLGKVRVPAAGVPAPGEQAVPQIFPLEKRSLFSHIRGEITLKIYRIVADGHLALAKKDGGGKKKKNGVNPSNNNQSSPAVIVPPLPRKRAPQPARKEDSVPPDAEQIALAAPNRPYPMTFTLAGAGGGGGPHDFALKETQPLLGGGGERDKSSSTYDLVEKMEYLYVRVVRARDLPLAGGMVHAEVKLGNYRGVTRPFARTDANWDQVFAFSRDNIQSSAVEVFVREGGGPTTKDDFIGRLAFDLGEVPRRVLPDSTLAPQWCRMEGKVGGRAKGEVMLSVWFGTQADEAFAEAWHSRAAGVVGDGLSSIKAKVYMAPKLWYLRVSIIEAQDLVVSSSVPARLPKLFAKAQVGVYVLHTQLPSALPNPSWNEDLLFVVAEPFDDILTVSVEDRLSPGHEELLGRLTVPVSAIERRLDDKPAASRWFALDRGQGSGHSGGRVHLRLSLDGGYHVLDEAAAHNSDLQPTSRQLWERPVGILELGILSASGLAPSKPGGTYCVAKYGPKWIRTCTVVDSTSPRWNEQYTWEVFDPCTVITIGVFDNNRVAHGPPGMDTRIGKVRIRLSTLQTDRVYIHAYPLLAVHPSGVRKVGELQLAVRFSCADAASMLHAYARPMLPKMHYAEPVPTNQIERLRFQAIQTVTARLGRAEPPLGREVVEYMLDHGSHLWSMRRSKANFLRLVLVFSGLAAIRRWFEFVRSWQRPFHSAVFTMVFLFFVFSPELILPTAFFTTAVVGLCRYRSRPRHPPQIDLRLSHVDAVCADDLDEELDTFPTSRSPEVVRMRYDRLRSVAGRVQMRLGDMATVAERAESLLSWRDPRASFLFLMFCLLAAAVIYSVPTKVLVAAWGLYALRPPSLRDRLPSPLTTFFERLPTKDDILL